MWKLEVGTVKRLRILNLNLNRLIPDISIEDKARNGNKRDKVVPYPHLHDIRSDHLSKRNSVYNTANIYQLLNTSTMILR